MLSPEKNFKPLSEPDLRTTFLSEIKALDRVAGQVDIGDILAGFADYKHLLEQAGTPDSPFAEISDFSNTRRIVSVTSGLARIQSLFAAAHLAACSILLEGIQIDLVRLESGKLARDMEAYLQNLLERNPQAIQHVMQKLIGMDAVRTIQMLRLAGLISRKTEDICQLGLGAATGNKDVHYVHTEPLINSLPGKNGLKVGFGALKKSGANIIISDLDQRHAPLYKYYAEDSSSAVSGFIGDTYGVLDMLKEQGVRKSNLITMLRIEPAMIPDINGFLRRLRPVLAEGADFVLSIGAGDSPEAYKQRIDKVEQLFGRLEEMGLEPVIFRLHLGGGVMQQAASLQFGNASTASYEILYCRMHLDSLNKL